SHFRHEATWPAQVDIRLTRHADFVEDRSRQMTCSIEILAGLVERAWLAVTDIAPTVRERKHKAANFAREWVMLPVPGHMQPQDWPCRAIRRESVQHRKTGRRPNPCTEQHRRSLSRLENEASPR